MALPFDPSSTARLRALVAAALVALAASGCLKRSPVETTGSIDANAPMSADAYRRQAEAMAARFEANPGDPGVALAYARALRGSDQRAQAVAVLQQAAIRSPSNFEILAAYGKALADVGRYKEASEVLSRAHLPERPDWRILSAQGTVADQLGDHVQAQGYYETALRIVPGEPSVLSNLGLSYALSKRLPEAEKVLRQGASHGSADARIRQNLALVLGLQGKFAEAEEILKRDLSPAETEANLSAMRSLVSQPNSWKVLRQADGAKSKVAQKPSG